jgi:hypothetical protein
MGQQFQLVANGKEEEEEDKSDICNGTTAMITNFKDLLVNARNVLFPSRAKKKEKGLIKFILGLLAFRNVIQRNIKV